MSETGKRKTYTAQFKAKVAMEAIRSTKTINEIATAYGVHPVMVSQWKKEMLDRASELFETKRGPKPMGPGVSEERLYSEIGRLKMEVDFLKKNLGE